MMRDDVTIEIGSCLEVEASQRRRSITPCEVSEHEGSVFLGTRETFPCEECGLYHTPAEIVNNCPICLDPPAVESPDLPSVWRRMPNTAFGIAMGLAGSSIMWKTASQQIRGVSSGIGAFFWFLSLIAFLSIGSAYIHKIFCNTYMVRDEWNNPTRLHFMNAPTLSMIMLALGVPSNLFAEIIPGYASSEKDILCFFWSLGFCLQLILSLFIYERWLFSLYHNLVSTAQPQFLLSLVGWFLLAALGQVASVSGTWGGLNFPLYCFGAGLILYLQALVSIINRLHQMPTNKGSPALTLLIAPPSVGVNVLLNAFGEDAASVLLGWCLLLFFLLLKLGPKIAAKPPVLGTYWAYVFPLSALTTAVMTVSLDSRSGIGAHIFSLTFLVIASLAVLIVIVRMCIHIFGTIFGTEQWGDPLVVMDAILTQRSKRNLEEATATSLHYGTDTQS